MKHFKQVIVIIALFSFTTSVAQTNYFTKFSEANRWSAGIQLSPNYLFNDAEDGKVGFGAGAHAKYSFGQSFGLNFNADLGTLKGTKDNSSYEFTNKFKQLDITGVYTIGNISFLRPLRDIQMYSFFGLGMTFSDANGTFGDLGGDYAGTSTAYKGRNAVVPLGFGFKKNVSDKLDLAIEYRDNYVRSDMVDGMDLPQQANRYANDHYQMFSIKASMKFGDKAQTAHMDWLNPLETIYADIDSLISVTAKLQGDADKESGGSAQQNERQERHKRTERKGEEGTESGAPGGAELLWVKAELFANERLKGNLRIGHQALGNGLRLVIREATRLVDRCDLGLLLFGHRL